MDDFLTQDDEESTSEQGEQESQGDSTGAAGESKGEESDSGALLKQMQSERDKAVALANKTQKELEQMKGKASASGKGRTASVPEEVQQWITAAKENTRKALFEQNEKFGQYGVDPSLIVGETPVEMRASAESLAKFVTEIESKVRGQVLVEHGFDPEPRSTTSTGRKDYATMDSKDFNALVEEALRG